MVNTHIAAAAADRTNTIDVPFRNHCAAAVRSRSRPMSIHRAVTVSQPPSCQASHVASLKSDAISVANWRLKAGGYR